MKTITEFSGFQLSEALVSYQEWTTAGKTAEEVATALTEKYKYDGDKLKIFIASLEAVKDRSQSLKRIVVIKLDEGEKAPQGSIEKEGFQYLAEYFYVPPTRSNDRRDRKGRGGKSAGGRSEGRRDGGRREKSKQKTERPAKKSDRTIVVTPVSGGAVVVSQESHAASVSKQRKARPAQASTSGPKGPLVVKTKAGESIVITIKNEPKPFKRRPLKKDSASKSQQQNQTTEKVTLETSSTENQVTSSEELSSLTG